MSDYVPHEELVEFFKSHVRAEMALDLDAAMAGINENPVFHVAPLFRVTGRDAVRELYVRVMAGRGVWSSEGYDVIDDPIATQWGPNSVWHQFPLGPYPVHEGLVAMALFDGLSIVSENAYIFDPKVAKTYADYFGEDFLDVPGVERWP